VTRECVFEAPDFESIYEVPLAYYNRHVDDLFVDMFHLNRSACRIHKFREVVETYTNNNLRPISIGIFGKYDNCDEAYISLKEALLHAGIANDSKVEIHWFKSEDLEKYKDNRGLHKFFENLDGIIVPGGFDNRGIEGKIRCIQYAREKKVPFLGICLGLQCAVIEFSRNVCRLEGANSMEFDKETKNPVVKFVSGQDGLTKKSASMRLGAYDCELKKETIAYELYGQKTVRERHRHRYEVNESYIQGFEEAGFLVSGRNPQTNLVEIMELNADLHPFFIGTQAHPEFKSRLTAAAPLFKGLIAAAIKNKKVAPENINKA
jgi:CTP synthase